MPDRDYPSTVLEVVDDGARFRPAALKTVRVFAASNPWKGTIAERKQKLRGLKQSLAVAYGMREPELAFGRIDGSSSGRSYYEPTPHRIVIIGKLSVVTFLHEFGQGVLFYAIRVQPTIPRPPQARSPRSGRSGRGRHPGSCSDQTISELRHGLAQLGLTEVTDAGIRAAIADAYPDGHADVDRAELLRIVFDRFNCQDSPDNVAR